MPSPLEWRHVSGMYPFDVMRAVLHLVAPSGVEGDGALAGAAQVAQFQSAHGWRVTSTAVGSVRQAWRAVVSAEPDVVVLHGRGAGRLGRMALRGRVPTVYRPLGPVAPGHSGPPLLWERWAARWTNLVVLDSASEAEQAVARGIRAPLLVANPRDLRRQCAAIARAHAFGRPAVEAQLGGAA